MNDAGRDDPVLGVLPERLDAFQWHYYGFELPDGAELLADNDAARQAYRLGERTWGVQFHPEVTRHMLDHWFVEGEEELPDPAARQAGDRTSTSPTWNDARPAALRCLPRRRRPAEPHRYCSIGSSSFDRPLVPGARVVARVVAGGRSTCTAVAERMPEWQYATTSAPSGAPTSARISAASRRADERLHVDVARAGEMALPGVAGIARLAAELDLASGRRAGRARPPRAVVRAPPGASTLRALRSARRARSPPRPRDARESRSSQAETCG